MQFSDDHILAAIIDSGTRIFLVRVSFMIYVEEPFMATEKSLEAREQRYRSA
jgi:hypothetical protein